MSWISGLADKAENILNKIDKNAATALQVPAGGVLNPNTMRKSHSSGALSLKSAYSPAKNSVRPIVKVVGGSGTWSVKSEGGNVVGMSDSVDSKDKLEWSINTEMASSRRSSLSSKGESVAIDMALIDSENVSKPSPPIVEVTKRATTLQSTHTTLSDQMSSSISESQELAAFKIALNEVTNERDELRLRLSMLNHDVENAALKQRAQDLEALTQRLTEERDQSQQELHESQRRNSAYVHSISDLETNLAKLQQEYLEASMKLQMQKRETEHQRQDLQEYRTKAQLALQMKDSLIAEMKASAGGPGTAEASSPDSEVYLLKLEFDALKQEHQHALEESQNLMLQLEETRHGLSVLNKQHADQLETLRGNEEALRKELRSERARVLATESEQRVLLQELEKLRQQLSNHMAASSTRLQEMEQQLQQLRAQKREGTFSGDDSALDYDSRIKSLTQALVDKQNNVQNITADRNALRIQMEKMQDQLQQQTIYKNRIVNSTSSTALLSNTTDDVKAQFPFLMRENPFDNRVARRMKRAYFSLERFLRRYPLMRLFILLYMGLLHIWVIFILLSTTPN